MYICRKVGLQFVERIVQLFGEFQRTGIRLFCHSEQYCRTCLLACHAEFGRLVAYLDVCDIGKRYHALAVFLHDAGTDLVDIVGRGDAADDIFVAVFIADTTIGVSVQAITSESDTPKCFILPGLISIWYSLMSPPCTLTCATPPVESSCGRITQSA